MRQKGIAGSPPQVQEEGAIGTENSQDFGGPFRAPEEKGLTWGGVVVAAVVDPQVVRRGSDDHVHTLIFEFGHATEAIAMVELE